MSGRRTYGDACGVARALDAVGERWALMVVRELLLGPKRFTDIRAGLPSLSADVLAQRLRGLEQMGVVRRRTLPPPAASKVYELTAAGAALEPAILALGLWGGAHAAPPAEGMCMSFDSHILSLRTLFRADLAGDLEAALTLRLGDQRFRARVAGGSFEIESGEEPGAVATIVTDPGILIDVVHGRLDLTEARATGDLLIEGDEAIATRFLTLFPLPEPAPA